MTIKIYSLINLIR